MCNNNRESTLEVDREMRARRVEKTTSIEEDSGLTHLRQITGYPSRNVRTLFEDKLLTSRGNPCPKIERTLASLTGKFQLRNSGREW